MHDIWNPWHGCVRKSEGCENCYMFFLDSLREQDGSLIRRNASFRYPLSTDRSGHYRVRSGEMLRVCMTSDFFLEEADPWRPAAWNIIASRRDVIFYLLTKRPERMAACLPPDWGDGWENVFLNVTCENQKRAEERMPILLDTPARHRGVMCAPLIGPVSLAPWLSSGLIERVAAGGENYGGKRVCDFDWIRHLYSECREADVTFAFIETGTSFRKDGRLFHLPSKKLQSEMAFRSGMQYEGRPIQFQLQDPFGNPLNEEELYRPVYDGPLCSACGSRLICNGCAHCNACTPQKKQRR